MVSDATNLHIWNTLFELSGVDFSEIPSPHYTIVKGKLFLMSVTDSFQRWSWYWLLLNSWEKLSVASLLSRGTRARACPAYKCPQKPKMCSPRAKKAQSGAKKSPSGNRTVDKATEVAAVSTICWLGSSAKLPALPFQAQRNSIISSNIPTICLPDQNKLKLTKFFCVWAFCLKSGGKWKTS